MFWYVLTIIGVILSIIGAGLCIVAIFSCLRISSLESRMEEQLLRKMQEEQDKENTN